MTILKNSTLGIWSLLLIYFVIIFLNSSHLYELILLYPIFDQSITLPEMLNAAFFIVFPIVVCLGIFFLRPWGRRMAMVLSIIAILLNLIGLVKYKDWYLLYSLGLHTLIYVYLMQPATKQIFSKQVA